MIYFGEKQTQLYIMKQWHKLLLLTITRLLCDYLLIATHERYVNNVSWNLIVNGMNHLDFELKKVLLPPREFCRHILS